MSRNLRPTTTGAVAAVAALAVLATSFTAIQPAVAALLR